VVTIEFSTDIDRPLEEVFAWLTDPDRLPQWQSSAVEVRQQSDGPVGVGTRFKEVRRMLGRRLESEVEVTVYEQPRRFAVRSQSGPVPFEADQTLEPTEAGTRVHFRGKGEPGGFFKLAEPLVARAVERQFRSDFETLKDILESQE
jgi:uncharacterized protein YndB with AHSA1/START domain